MGVNWKAYKAILNIASSVRLVCTDENHLNILQVIQVLNALLQTDEDDPIIHLDYQSSFSFPSKVLNCLNKLESD